MGRRKREKIKSMDKLTRLHRKWRDQDHSFMEGSVKGVESGSERSGRGRRRSKEYDFIGENSPKRKRWRSERRPVVPADKRGDVGHSLRQGRRRAL